MQSSALPHAAVTPKFRRALTAHHLVPLWEIFDTLVPSEPKPRARVAKWDYDTLRAQLLVAGMAISAQEAERRVLILENPGLEGSARIGSSLYAGVQLLLPGETAPEHRHSQSALRFFLEGEGCHTAVQGREISMRPFDLVLTPSMVWHDHGNGGKHPAIWLDGLDIPIVDLFSAEYAERIGNKTPPPRSVDRSLELAGRNLRPVFPGNGPSPMPHQKLVHYPYSDWRPAIEAMLESAGPDPHFGARMEFVNPANGGPIMPTISAFTHLIPRGMSTAPVRSTETSVFVVVTGEGFAVVGDEALPLQPRDVFVVPSWHPLVLTAEQDIVLFSYSDRAAQRALGLWREEVGE